MRHTKRPRRPRRGLVATIVASAALLAGCGGGDDRGDDRGGDASEPVAAAAAPEHGLVTPDEAARLVASGVTVIDVRTPEEFAEGHIEGATLIDFYGDSFADEIAALDPEGDYLVYCRSGNRSGQAVALMQQSGIERVWDLDGGVVGAAGSTLTFVR